MPLLDHFRPPLSERRHWHSFHNSWATAIASQLNAALPEGYFAEPHVQFAVEIDVAAMEEPGGSTPGSGWTPADSPETFPLAVAGPLVEVGVFSQSGGPTLAGAVELVSPANKDRAETRAALVSKCASYLQSGVGLLLIDIVTDRRADLHGELLDRSGAGVTRRESELFASAYRPVMRDDSAELDVWHATLQLGRPLPTMPLWLRGGLCLPVDLESSYERTCDDLRMRRPAPAAP